MAVNLLQHQLHWRNHGALSKWRNSVAKSEKANGVTTGLGDLPNDREAGEILFWWHSTYWQDSWLQYVGQVNNDNLNLTKVRYDVLLNIKQDYWHLRRWKNSQIVLIMKKSIQLETWSTKTLAGIFLEHWLRTWIYLRKK